MKKLKLILTMLCAFVGISAWAQTAPEVSTAENPKWYKIRSYNRGGFLTDAGSGSTLTHVAMTSDSYWRFEDAGTNDGAMHMISKKGNAVSGKWTTGETAMKIWVLANGVNQYGMSISASSAVSGDCMDANNANSGVGIWHPATNDWQGTTWVFIEANPYATIVSIGEAATSIEEGQWYLLYNKGRNGYPSIEHGANSSSLTMRAKTSMAVDTIAHNKGNMLYKFTKHGDNYYVATGDQLYFTLAQNSAAVAFQPRAYSIKNITDQTNVFWLQDSVSGYVANGQEINNGFVGWNQVEPGAISNGAYQFLPVEICSQDVEYILTGASDPIKIEKNVKTLPTVGGTVTIDETSYTVSTVTPSAIVNEKRTVTVTLTTGSCVNYVHNGTTIKTVEDTTTPQETIVLDNKTYFLTASYTGTEGGKTVCTATVKTLSEILPTGYYTIASVTDRATFLYGANTLATNPNKFTLQSQAATTPGNQAIWKVSANDETLKVSVLNQQGKGLVNNRNTATEYKEVTVGSFFKSNNSFYFTEAINASGGGQAISSGERHLTYWDGHPEATDNHWKFASVDANNILNVTITGTTEATYVTYNSDIALNGGFFVSDSPITSTESFTASHVSGMKATMSIADGTLTVAYTEEEDVAALKADLQTFINVMPEYTAAGVGYYTEATIADVITAKTAAQAVIANDNATADDVKNAKAAIQTAQAALVIELPTDGKYYYIQSALAAFNPKKGMYQDASVNKWNTLNKADFNFVWQWNAKGDDGWAVKNIGGDNYLNTVSDLSATEPSGNITLLWLELGQFNIKATGGAKMHCESHGGGSGVSGNIVGWDAGANTASAWSIIELTTEDVKALAQAQIAEFNTLQAGTEIGYFAQDTYNTAKAAKEALEANETMDNVIDLRNAIKAAKQNVNSPKPGHFYAIRDHRYNTYVDGSLTAPSTVTGMVGKMAHTAKENDKLKAGHIWYFDNDMKGYSFDAGFGVKNATEKAGATDAKVFTFELKDDKTECPKTFAVRVPNGENNVNTYWYIHNTGAEKYGYVDRNGTTYAANNCQFYIEEVKELTLNVTSAKAATLCLPVACRVPADLKVYTATGTVVEKENRLQLQLIQKEGDNTTLLPANTPVFVWGPAGAYTLDLDVTAASIDGTNIFSGTTAAIAHDTSDNAMVLGRESTTDDLGFFRTTSTSINGFRAYLSSSKVDELFPATSASVRGIKVTFTDITTAIEAAHSNISEGATCDINGRQVRNIGKGLYIVNGKKIMVK
mgnify:CR=1 FL=1